MRGAQFSATLNSEKCSDLCEVQATTSVPCQDGFALVLATVLYRSHGRDHLWGLQGLQIRSSAFWEMLFDFPFRNFRNLTSSEGVHDLCSTTV